MIKAIQTSYKGYRFRSRLEARWAVFFDALGLEWEFEPEGFELSDGSRYLPDFKVHGKWAEVKPTRDLDGFEKAIRFGIESGTHIFLLGGNPDALAYPVVDTDGSVFDFAFVPKGDKYHPFFWCSGAELFGSPDMWLGYEEDMQFAVAAARSARFEFGESGGSPRRVDHMEGTTWVTYKKDFGPWDVKVGDYIGVVPGLNVEVRK